MFRASDRLATSLIYNSLPFSVLVRNRPFLIASLPNIVFLHTFG